MLVDLGRNDLARVCLPATVQVQRVMEVERYSHVMHLSSTITGRLAEGVHCWAALRAPLPVRTVTGHPQLRAMPVTHALAPASARPACRFITLRPPHSMAPYQAKGAGRATHGSTQTQPMHVQLLQSTGLTAALSTVLRVLLTKFALC